MAMKFALQEMRVASISDIVSDPKAISEMDLATAEETRSLLKSTWTKFESEHEKIMSSSREAVLELPYFKEGRYQTTMHAYLAGICLINQRISALQSSQSSQASTLGHSRARASLPSIDLPKFAGAFSEWKSFEDLFTSLVRDNKDISQVEKLHYLRSSLEGEAAREIASLKLSAEAFDIAWDRLAARYDNKRRLILAQLDKLLELPQVRARTSQALQRVVDSAESSLSSLEALGCAVEGWGPIVLHRVRAALDSKTQEDWEMHLGASTELPPYQRILAFVSATARALEHVEGTKSHKNVSRSSQGPASSSGKSYARVLTAGPSTSPPPPLKRQSSPKTSSQQTSQRPPAAPGTSQGRQMPFIRDLSNNCSYCRGPHYLAFCPRFTALNHKAKVEVVVEARLCYNCLGRHNLRQCRSTRRCNVCQQQHHTLIHPELPTMRPPTPKTSQVQFVSSSHTSDTTMSSQRLPSLSDQSSHPPSRQKSSKKRSSHFPINTSCKQIKMDEYQTFSLVDI